MKRLFLALFLLSACSSTSAPASGASRPGAAVPIPAAAAETQQQAPRAAVASVVILEKKECCACTGKRQNDARAAFDAEVARREVKPPVTLVFVDTEPAKAQVYQDMQAPVATPAYYFLDAAGSMVSFLQGEITGDQMAAALGAR
jgi:hypothetical protein